MVRELAAERALDDGFLESADRGLELLVRDRSLADKLVENLGRDRRQRRLRTLAFRFAVHSHPSCYAPHTKFLTPSLKEEQRSPRGCIASRMQPDFYHGRPLRPYRFHPLRPRLGLILTATKCRQAFIARC